MKVGDLVELSSSGNTLNMCSHRRGVVGLIETIASRTVAGGHVEPQYSVFWTDAKKPRDGWRYNRRDLRHARRKKNGE
jgi:hypothetical protein